MLKEVNQVEFKQQYRDDLVLAEFYSKTCGPCKMLAFVLREIDKQLGEKVKILQVEFNENPELASEFTVTGYPTLIVFKDGVEQSRISGLQQKPQIIQMLEAHL